MKKAYVNGTIYTMKEEYDTCSAFVVENSKNEKASCNY